VSKSTMTAAEKKVLRRMRWEALLRGCMWRPMKSVDELLAEFYRRVEIEEQKGASK
jgi:succinate dehydrogenase flavin-adding protein (antitoxin of CptAB toxin-antitoxin module)